MRGIEGNGQSSNCGRTNKDGIDFIKADEHGFERTVALYHTPQEHGGCQGCRFFLMCKGQCPGTAIDGDWRNRTEHCGVWMTLFTHVERKLLTRGETPLTLSTARKSLERRALAEWRSGRNPQLGSLRPKAEDPPRLGAAGARRAAVGGVRYLDFEMHGFRRCSWVSDAARLLWEERFHQIERSLATLAVLAVAEGRSPCAMIEVRPEQSFALGQLAAAHDLAVAILQRGQGRRRQPPQPGTPSSAPLPEGVPVLDVLAIGSPRQVGELHRLHKQALFDDLERLLGYPDASRTFAQRVYDEMGLRDPIWPMALATVDATTSETGPTSLRVPCAPHSNFLLASIGLAPAPFQPTSFDCPHAAAHFAALVTFGSARGFADEMGWLREILSWPMQWSALHGIAETRTPVLKISSDTDATADKLTLNYLGTAEAALAAQGLGFPYLPARRRQARAAAN